MNYKKRVDEDRKKQIKFSIKSKKIKKNPIQVIDVDFFKLNNSKNELSEFEHLYCHAAMRNITVSKDTLNIFDLLIVSSINKKECENEINELNNLKRSLKVSKKKNLYESQILC